jgi:outer membrane lipoprotein LolB
LYRFFGAALLAALLAACGGQSTQPDLPPRPPRNAIERFTLEGRMAINQSGRSNTLRVNWEHAPERDLIGFSGPLGNQLAELQRDQQGARLIGANGEHHEAPDADQLLARLTETPVPLDSLALWALGRISAQATHLQFDPAGRLVTALDNGWMINITRYENESPNALPATLEVENENLRVKIAIEAWQL